MGMRSVSRLVILGVIALTGLSGCAGPHYLISRPLEAAQLRAWWRLQADRLRDADRKTGLA